MRSTLSSSLSKRCIFFVLTKKFGASSAGIPGSECRLGYFSLYPTDTTKILSLFSWWSKAHNLDNLHPELNPNQPTHQLHAAEAVLRNVPRLVK